MPIRNNTEGTKNIENTRETPKLDILIDPCQEIKTDYIR